MLPSTEQTAEFSSGRISGTGGCNRFNGTYRTAQGNQLSIGTLATTFMACEAGVMTQETAFLTALQAAQRYEVNRDGLQISYRTPQGTGVLRLTSQTTPTLRPTPTPSGRTYEGRGISSGSIFTKGRQSDATLNIVNNNFTLGLEATSRLGLAVQYRGTVIRQRSGSSLGRNGFVFEGRIRNFASSATGLRSLPTVGNCRVEVFNSRVILSECDTAIYQNSTRFQGLQQF
jgi:heat shock protein HslJ